MHAEPKDLYLYCIVGTNTGTVTLLLITYLMLLSPGLTWFPATAEDRVRRGNWGLWLIDCSDNSGSCCFFRTFQVTLGIAGDGWLCRWVRFDSTRPTSKDLFVSLFTCMFCSVPWEKNSCRNLQGCNIIHDLYEGTLEFIPNVHYHKKRLIEFWRLVIQNWKSFNIKYWQPILKYSHKYLCVILGVLKSLERYTFYMLF